jgi:hypothetical protein
MWATRPISNLTLHGWLEGFILKGQVGVIPSVSPVTVNSAQGGYFPRVVLLWPRLTLIVKELGVCAVDATQASLDNTIAIIDIVISHGEVLFVKTVQAIEQRARRE